MINQGPSNIYVPIVISIHSSYGFMIKFDFIGSNWWQQVYFTTHNICLNSHDFIRVYAKSWFYSWIFIDDQWRHKSQICEIVSNDDGSIIYHYCSNMFTKKQV